MLNYFYDCYTILNKVYSEKTFVKQAINSTIIEEKNRSMTIKTVYGVLDKDIELSYYISSMVDKSPKLAIRTILKISMYCIKYLGKKEYAVCQNAVELTKKLGKTGASGFVNAFLRKFISKTPDLPKDITKNLSIKYSFPEFAVKMLLEKYGEEKTKEIISIEDDANYLFFPNLDGEEYLKNNNVNFRKTPFSKLFAVKNFIRNEDFDKGIYTFQSLGSYAICDLVEPCECLLDCCSAPGGKTINLSYKCDKIVSWDVHPHRIELVKSYLSRMNVLNVETRVYDSKIIDKDCICKFDAVLCDAPCSGLGVTIGNPDIKLNRSIEDVYSLNKEQKGILKAVSNYVKVGGYLYYSTCSILDIENINIVRDFLSKNDNYVIEKIDSKLDHVDIDGTNQFLPNISNGQGFYVAKLKRIK